MTAHSCIVHDTACPRCDLSRDEVTPDPRIDIVWPLLARPDCDLWERHQAEQLAARILHALDEQETP